MSKIMSGRQGENVQAIRDNWPFEDRNNVKVNVENKYPEYLKQESERA